MKTILILGAGRSSPSLISYLSKEASMHHWKIIVGDADPLMARNRLQESSFIEVIQFTMNDPDSTSQIISSADLVISLLPAAWHLAVAKCCLLNRKHLITASYVSEEMKGLHEEALAKGLLFLNECGLDPGIDHMSAMQIIDRIKREGGNLLSFESFTGGLIAPETDPENPWRYKFTWNPRNVVMAGQGTAKFLQDGRNKYIPYQQVFRQTTPVHVSGHGDYEGYVNRDSLKYIELYGLHGIRTMLRGTLRYKGFCSTWNVFVQLGCCDDTYQMEDVASMTHHDFLNCFLINSKGSLQDRLANELSFDRNGPEIKYLTWSGFFDDELIGINEGSPAQILEHILAKKWKLLPGDKDMIVMWHRFRFEKDGTVHDIEASLGAKGDNEIFTAMAKTVGWPLGIAAKLLLQDKINQRGVVIPVDSEFYDPILKELSDLGIFLSERRYQY